MKKDFTEIRLILIKWWDPIGVSHFSTFDIATEDEYDGYARAIARQIKSGASEDDILEYLRGIEEVDLGLPFDSERAAMVAKKVAGT